MPRYVSPEDSLQTSIDTLYLSYWLFYIEKGELHEIECDELPEFITDSDQRSDPDQQIQLFDAQDPWEQFLLSTIGGLCSHFSTDSKTAVSWSVIDRYGWLWWKHVRYPQLQAEWRRFLKWKLFGWLIPMEPVELSIPLGLHLSGSMLGRSPWTRLGVTMQRLIDKGYVEIMKVSDHTEYGEYDDVQDAFYRLSAKAQLQHRKRVLDLITP